MSEEVQTRPQSSQSDSRPSRPPSQGQGRPPSQGRGRPPSQGRSGGYRGSRGRPQGQRRYGRGRFDRRRKVCAFCLEKAKTIDYKDVPTLRRYLTDRGKIKSRRKTGTCAKHQRRLAVAVKRARHIALLPFTAEHIRRY
jgi:small subunit ribosomal protein S18